MGGGQPSAFFWPAPFFLKPLSWTPSISNTLLHVGPARTFHSYICHDRSKQPGLRLRYHCEAELNKQLGEIHKNAILPKLKDAFFFRWSGTHSKVSSQGKNLLRKSMKCAGCEWPDTSDGPRHLNLEIFIFCGRFFSRPNFMSVFWHF